MGRRKAPLCARKQKAMKVRTHQDYPGYLVSSTGDIQGPGRHNNPTWLKPQEGRDGYLHVRIRTSDNIFITRTVHRLVCEAFNGDKPSWADQVRHLNGVHTDNRASNLAWGTYFDNEEDKRNHGTRISSETLHEIRIGLADKLVTQKMLGELYGVSQPTICNVRKTYGSAT